MSPATNDRKPEACSSFPPPSLTQVRSMKRRLFEVLSSMETSEVTSLLDKLWSLGSFQIRKPPEKGLVMYRACDPFDTQFHLGEVLCCESTVELDGYTGWGMIIGEEPERSLLLACVEAAQFRGNIEMLNLVSTYMENVKQRSEDHREMMSKLTSSTSVRFDSMKKETVDFGSLGQ